MSFLCTEAAIAYFRCVKNYVTRIHFSVNKIGNCNIYSIHPSKKSRTKVITYSMSSLCITKHRNAPPRFPLPGDHRTYMYTDPRPAVVTQLFSVPYHGSPAVGLFSHSRAKLYSLLHVFYLSLMHCFQSVVRWSDTITQAKFRRLSVSSNHVTELRQEDGHDDVIDGHGCSTSKPVIWLVS